MIVVSDTSPITALLTIGAAGLLAQLFQDVIIPPAVRDELLRSHAVLPSWLQVRAVQSLEQVRKYAHTVDLGEAEAIQLAQEIRADRLLVDERKGRTLAQREGVPIIGLLGVVLLAKRRRLIPSARQILQRLEFEAGMYLATDIRETALNAVGE
jgi:uncharacterized protein